MRGRIIDHDAEQPWEAAASRLTRRELLVRSSLLGASVGALTGLVGPLAGEALAGPEASSLRGARIIALALGLQFKFQVGMYDSLKKLGEAEGARIEVVDGRADASLQAMQAQRAIVQKPDVLVLDPADPKLLAPAVAKANSAGVPVFVLETAPPGEWVALVEFGDEQAGRLAARTMARLIGGKGLVLECRGAGGYPQAALRHKGFRDEVKASYPGIKIKTLKTEWAPDLAFTLVSDALNTRSDVAGVWSHNDEMVAGVVSALRQVGLLAPAGQLGHIPIVGLDGTPQALARIRAGTQDASMGQNPFAMGRLAIRRIEEYLRHERVPQTTRVPPIVITKANVDDPKLWGNVFGKKR